MKLNGRILLISILIFALISCRKSIGHDIRVPAPPVPPKNTWIAGISREVALILEKIYDNHDAYHEVNAAIYSHYYEDERVMLKDLLFTEMSKLYGTEAFKRFKTKQGIFRKLFFEELKKENYPLLRSLMGALLIKQSDTDIAASSDQLTSAADSSALFSEVTGVAIYFPYSDHFADTVDKEIMKNKVEQIKPAAIVYTDREADSGPGREPYTCSQRINGTCYRDITVNDKYVENNPTHIVAVGAKPKSMVLYNPSLLPSVTRIYHGWSKLTKQMDKLISVTGNGGGSEVKIGRISGYLNVVDQKVTGFSGDVVTVYYTRSDISNKKWKRVFSVWDPNWNKADLEQVYAVYEEDTQGMKTFNGSVRTGVTWPHKPSAGKAQGEIGFKIEVKTQEDIITQRKLERTSFLADGLNNQGWGYIPDTNDFLGAGKDWPVCDGGTMWQHSMAWKIY